jgi:hypothetical protein
VAVRCVRAAESLKSGNKLLESFGDGPKVAGITAAETFGAFLPQQQSTLRNEDGRTEDSIPRDLRIVGGRGKVLFVQVRFPF